MYKDWEPAKLRVLGTSTTNPVRARPWRQPLQPAVLTASIDEANFGEIIPELLKPVSGDYDAYLLLLDMEGFHTLMRADLSLIKTAPFSMSALIC